MKTKKIQITIERKEPDYHNLSVFIFNQSVAISVFHIGGVCYENYGC